MTWFALQMLLEAALGDPKADLMQLPVISETDLEAMHAATNPQPPTDEAAGTCLHQLFEASAEAHPDATCIPLR